MTPEDRDFKALLDRFHAVVVNGMVSEYNEAKAAVLAAYRALRAIKGE